MTTSSVKTTFKTAGEARHLRAEYERSPAHEMKSAIVKRSIELNGHKTSVSLEDEFWTSLRTIATVQNVSLPALLQGIDANREGANLSSAIRVHVLNYYRTRASRQESDPGPLLPPPLPPSA